MNFLILENYLEVIVAIINGIEFFNHTVHIKEEISAQGYCVRINYNAESGRIRSH